MSDDKTPPSGKDLITFGPDLGDGSRPFFRHRPDHTLETGISRAVTDGQPMNMNEGGSLVKLTPVEDASMYEVETLYEHRTSGQEGKGPAKVNSNAYRSGWDSIFGAKKTVGEA